MSNIDQFEMVARLLFALALGAAVGLEREYRGHEAGLRTAALVCAGSALFGEVSTTFGDSRVAAGVVQGIGFLGAGLIFRRGLSVQNVTTAVTMWALAATGLAVARSLWIVAGAVVFGLVVLLELSVASDWVYRTGRRRRGESVDTGPSGGSTLIE